jgi:hypothetical protein
MTGAVYLAMVQELLPAHLPLLGCTRFQQDNAPCHAARIIKAWMANNNIELLSWPGNSPDLNPIENCWTLLKRKVGESKPSSIPDLIAKVKTAWNENITANYCQNLISSMPRRIQAVMDARGGTTKY